MRTGARLPQGLPAPRSMPRLTIADRPLRSSSPQKSKPDCRRTPTTAQDGEERPKLRGGKRVLSHDAPAREHKVRDRVAYLDPAKPRIRLDGQPEDAKRVQQCAGLDPQLGVIDHLVALPEVLEHRDAAPIVAGRVLCPDGLAPDCVDRLPAA